MKRDPVPMLMGLVLALAFVFFVLGEIYGWNP